MKLLENKIIFITGSTSGIGKACSDLFASLGADLILCGRRLSLLTELSAFLKSKYQVKVYSKQLDVRKMDDVDSFVKKLPKEWKNIDILVNNAGLARGLAKFYEDDVTNWEEMIDTNIKGLLYVSRAVSQLMIKRKRGHIVNIGSIAGHEVYPKGGIYCGSKHAVDAITKALRMDLLEHNIKVSTIDPGLVETEFSIVRFHGDAEKAKQVYKGIEPLTARDIAETILFMITRPTHVNIAEVIIFPSRQASATMVNREG